MDKYGWKNAVLGMGVGKVPLQRPSLLTSDKTFMNDSGR
jgi:hypothetical protein